MYIVSTLHKFDVHVSLKLQQRLLKEVSLRLRCTLHFEDSSPVPVLTKDGVPTPIFHPGSRLEEEIRDGIAKFTLRVGADILSNTLLRHKKRFRIRVDPADESDRAKFPGLFVESVPFKSVVKLKVPEQIQQNTRPIEPAVQPAVQRGVSAEIFPEPGSSGMVDDLYNQLLSQQQTGSTVIERTELHAIAELSAELCAELSAETEPSAVAESETSAVDDTEPIESELSNQLAVDIIALADAEDVHQHMVEGPTCGGTDGCTTNNVSQQAGHGSEWTVPFHSLSGSSSAIVASLPGVVAQQRVEVQQQPLEALSGYDLFVLHEEQKRQIRQLEEDNNRLLQQIQELGEQRGNVRAVRPRPANQ